MKIYDIVPAALLNGLVPDKMNRLEGSSALSWSVIRALRRGILIFLAFTSSSYQAKIAISLWVIIFELSIWNIALTSRFQQQPAATAQEQSHWSDYLSECLEGITWVITWAWSNCLEQSLGAIAWSNRLEQSLGAIAWGNRLEQSLGAITWSNRLEPLFGLFFHLIACSNCLRLSL